MIVIDCEQGSPEWFAARLGKPTASEFDKIITAGGKPSTQADGLLHKLLAELITGKAAVFTESDWMKRGKEYEAEARDFLSFHLDTEIRQVGFVMTDCGSFGCSPDGMYAEGGCELKCPSPGVHVSYLLRGTIPPDYIPQVQGSMLVTGAPWWDFVSYHPDMPPLIVRVERDYAFHAALAEYMGKFLTRLEAAKCALIERGHMKEAT